MTAGDCGVPQPDHGGGVGILDGVETLNGLCAISKCSIERCEEVAVSDGVGVHDRNRIDVIVGEATDQPVQCLALARILRIDPNVHGGA